MAERKAMLKITKSPIKEPVYDITVEDNNNFFANDILVHNCAEIVEFTSKDEIAVCNLSSIVLKNYIEELDNNKEHNDKYVLSSDKKKVYNIEKLWSYVYEAIINLNRVIDINFYPVVEAENSNMRHRPVGLGVQGLSDVYYIMKFPFESPKAKKLNKLIFETIYHASITASNDLSRKEGAYSTFEGSPASNGKFQFDLWNEEKFIRITAINEKLGKYLSNKDYKENPAAFDMLVNELTDELNALIEGTDNQGNAQKHTIDFLLENHTKSELKDLKLYVENLCVLSGIWDWVDLTIKVKTDGLRNSLLTAIMPTASSSQITGSFECIEPITNNIYQRRTLSGNYQIINPYLVKDMAALELWEEDIEQEIINNEGSIQSIPDIPIWMKFLYKNMWEIKQRHVIEQAAGRAPYIDQTQSMNLYFSRPTYEKLFVAYILGWKLGLKTGVYYLRSEPASKAMKFSIDKTKLKNYREVQNAPKDGMIEDEECLYCGS